MTKSRSINVRVVHLKDCGSTPQALDRIRQAAADLGVGLNLETLVVEDQEMAENYRHIGSPTVQIDGLDIEITSRSVTAFGIT